MQSVINQRRQERLEKYEIGNKANNTWTAVRSINVERYFHAACVLQGRDFVVGRYSSVRKLKETVECYDPELECWEN